MNIIYLSNEINGILLGLQPCGQEVPVPHVFGVIHAEIEDTSFMEEVSDAGSKIAYCVKFWSFKIFGDSDRPDIVAIIAFDSSMIYTGSLSLLSFGQDLRLMSQCQSVAH